MTVRENLEMGAFIRNDAEVGRDIEGVMDKFPLLREKARAMAGSLSGGEQQILEMGRALLLRPTLVLLDEPSLGLAPRMTGLVFEKIREINRDGTTVVIVEQNARRALAISGPRHRPRAGPEAVRGHRRGDRPERAGQAALPRRRRAKPAPLSAASYPGAGDEIRAARCRPSSGFPGPGRFDDAASADSTRVRRPGRTTCILVHLVKFDEPDLIDLHILVVDDDLDLRESLSLLLELYGASVTAVGSAREALQVLSATVPDVLLSDLAMPGEDGYDLIRKVRALPPDREGRSRPPRSPRERERRTAAARSPQGSTRTCRSR